MSRKRRKRKRAREAESMQVELLGEVGPEPDESANEMVETEAALPDVPATSLCPFCLKRSLLSSRA